MVAVLLVLLLAPEPTHELTLRFEKGMVCEESSTRGITLKVISNGVLRFANSDECVVRRTVLEVGEDGLPSAERVEVLKSVATVTEAPDDKTGAFERPSQGKTFEWRRKRRGDFVLYEGEKDVSEAHKDLVQRLRSRGAARLPPGPVAVGATWEVEAGAFEASEGRIAPEGTRGKAVFKLEEVKDGVARISFEIDFSHPWGERTLTNKGKGIWLFDVKHGREISLEGEGKLEIDGKEGGFGTQKTSRTLTYR